MGQIARTLAGHLIRRAWVVVVSVLVAVPLVGGSGPGRAGQEGLLLDKERLLDQSEALFQGQEPCLISVDRCKVAAAGWLIMLTLNALGDWIIRLQPRSAHASRRRWLSTMLSFVVVPGCLHLRDGAPQLDERLAPHVSDTFSGKGLVLLPQKYSFLAIQQLACDEEPGPQGDARYDGVGVLICVGSYNEIRMLVGDRAGDPDAALRFPDDRLGVFTTDELLNARGVDNSGQVLVTTHQMILSRLRGRPFDEVSEPFYRGRPRRLRVWDETLLPGRPLIVERMDLASLFKPLSRPRAQPRGVAADPWSPSRRTAQIWLKGSPRRSAPSRPRSGWS